MQNSWSKIHAQALSSFLKKLNQEHIEWLIIRNFEGLPEQNTSKDIDIVISKLQWNNAHKILLETCRQLGFSYYILNNYQFINCYTFFNPQGISYKIDFFDCNEYKGLITHSFKSLNEKKQISLNGIFTSSPLHCAVTIWIRPLLGGGFVKEKYIPEIKDQYLFDTNGFRNEIYRLVGKRIGNKVCCHFNKDNIHETRLIRKKLIWNLFFQQFKKKPLSTLNNILLHNKSAGSIFIRNFFSKPKIIAVIGPDGTGKSTFIKGLCEALSYYFVSDESKAHVLHFRPTLLPNLGALGEKTRLMTEDKDYTRPHRGKPTGWINSFIRMTYYWFDYLLGVPYILFKDARSDNFTIYDRYIYDFLVDPSRSRINLPFWIRKVYAKLVIQPQIVFVLLTDAEIIYSRKQELTIAEIKRQSQEFSKIVNSDKRFVLIDASKSPQEMVDQAMKEIFARFTIKVV